LRLIYSRCPFIETPVIKIYHLVACYLIACRLLFDYHWLIDLRNKVVKSKVETLIWILNYQRWLRTEWIFLFLPLRKHIENIGFFLFLKRLFLREPIATTSHWICHNFSIYRLGKVCFESILIEFEIFKERHITLDLVSRWLSGEVSVVTRKLIFFLQNSFEFYTLANWRLLSILGWHICRCIIGWPRHEIFTSLCLFMMR